MEHNVASRSKSTRSKSRFAPETNTCCANEEPESRNRRGETSMRYQLKCNDRNIDELPIDHIANLHCKSLPSRNRDAGREGGVVQKRGSMYQSSSEIRRMQNLFEGRPRIKMDSEYDDDAFLSFEILDSSSSSSSSRNVSVMPNQKRPSVRSLRAESEHPKRVSMDLFELSFHDLPNEPEGPRADANLLKDDPEDSFIDIDIGREQGKAFSKPPAPELMQIESRRAKRTISNGMPTATASLSKSFSAKAALFEPGRPAKCTDDNVNVKNRSSPLKKILDPFLKPKSRSSVTVEADDNGAANPIIGKRNGVSRKSLLGDFSRNGESQDRVENIVTSSKEEQVHSTSSSPTHLHAILRLDTHSGLLLFEFSIKDAEEVISVKAWKTGNELSWVYTFHGGTKRGSSTGRISRDRCVNPSPVLGQMQVSTYLCSEPTEDGSHKNSALTEFVLYDIAHAHKFLSTEEKTHSMDCVLPPTSGVSDGLAVEDNHQKVVNERHHDTRPGHCNSNSSVSSMFPWSQDELLPHLQVAAIVIQLPFSKKEKSIGRKSEAANLSSAEQKKQVATESSLPGSVKVISPNGKHGMPAERGGCPSPLLDRWRNDGGCDCGGWDMSCSIAVLDGSYTTNWVETATEDSAQPMALCLQGRKDKLPDLSIAANGKGQFAVDFHGRLSALQAFGACIALLHCSEASSSFGLESTKCKSYSTSLKLLLEEEVRHLIEAVATEERRMSKRDAEKLPPSVVLDPPFSPIGRV